MALGRDKKKQQGRRRPQTNRETGRTFSYYSGSADSRPVPKAEKIIDLSGAGKRLRLIPTILLIVAIVGSILFSFTLSSQPNIELVEGQQPVYRPIDEYEAMAEKLLSSNFGNRTKLTINTNAVEQELLNRFPELNAAVLRLPVIGRKPNLVLDIKTPRMLLSNNIKTYALDRSGIIICEANDIDRNLRSELPAVRDESGLELAVGSQAVTTDTVGFVLAVSAQLEAQEIKLSQLKLPASANELDLHIEGLRYFVKTDTSGDARLQVGSFLAAREHLSDRGITPREYIDVRVGEKVFYK